MKLAAPGIDAADRAAASRGPQLLRHDRRGADSVLPARAVGAADAAAPRGDFLALTKPRLNLLVLVTTWAALYLGAPDALPLGLVVHTLVGTALVAGGASALNQVWERRTDALMRRTSARPLPSGRLRASEATSFGLLLAGTGVAQLAWGVNTLSAVVAALTLGSYVLLYTPLKTRTPLSTLVGAVPGALPPVIGWSAATGAITIEAWVLFGIVFLWQMPHFLAIGWMYRDDYARAGIPLLPVLEVDGRRTGQQALLYAAALWPVSLLPALVGLGGLAYSVIATLLGIGFIALSGSFARERTTARARQLFLYSIVYLPVLWAALVLNRLAM